MKSGVAISSVATPEACARFNELVPDSPRVRYFSVSGSRPDQRVPAFARAFAASVIGLPYAMLGGGALSLVIAVWIYASDPQLRRV